MVISIYTLVGIRLEEKQLKRIFGEAYSIYCSEVPALLPRFRSFLK
jgi:protein-S-isoprenylcysteine O-methyltransferase Ste14